MTSAKARRKRPPNTRLRSARQAVLPPGKGRETFARKLVLHAREVGVGFDCDVTKIRRWENSGVIPNDEALVVLASFFKPYGYTLADLGLAPEPVKVCTPPASAPTVAGEDGRTDALAGEDGDVKRRQLVAGAAVLAGLPALGPLSRSETPVVPATVGRREIERVRHLSIAFSRSLDAHGGEFARVAVVPELEWCAELLHSTCPPALRCDLFVAVARLAGTGGFAMFDAYDHANARTAFRFGVSCAEEAEDWSLRAQILGDMARQALWTGDPDRALTHVEMAQVRADRLTHAERAKLTTIRARALAKLGRVKETFRAVGEADELFGHAVPAEDPPWLNYRQTMQLNDTGHALADLALGGNPAEARYRLETAISGYSDAYARSRTISEAKLASLVMVTGDPHEAVAIGSHVLDTVNHVHSRRVLDYLRELGRHADRHADLAEVAELRGRIVELAAT